MRKLLIDTGMYVAYFHKKDRHHSSARKILTSHEYLHFTTDAVITEFLYIFEKYPNTQCSFLRSIAGSSTTIISFQNQEYATLADMIEKYKDLPMDFADATLVLGAEKLNTHYISTVDSDFSIYRIKGKKHFSIIR